MSIADIIMILFSVFIVVLCITFVVAVAKDSGAAKWRFKFEEEQHARLAAENKILELQNALHAADELAIFQQRRNAFLEIRLQIRDGNFSAAGLRKAMAFPIPKTLKVNP